MQHNGTPSSRLSGASRWRWECTATGCGQVGPGQGFTATELGAEGHIRSAHGVGECRILRHLLGAWRLQARLSVRVPGGMAHSQRRKLFGKQNDEER